MFKSRKKPNHRVYIDGQYVKVKHRTVEAMADAALRGTLVVHDQPYFRPGFDRRRFGADGEYLGMRNL